jgi:hypothetical protein
MNLPAIPWPSMQLRPSEAIAPTFNGTGGNHG